MIQYASRFIKYNAEGKNEAVFLAFKGLFGKSADGAPPREASPAWPGLGANEP